MALDGLYLRTIKNEIEQKALGSRIDKIYQPSREEIVLVLRGRGFVGKLLLSAGADSPRIHFTRSEMENPKSPPMFCMLLRKYLSGGKLTAVRQLGLDRVLYLDFEVKNELGDDAVITVACEIMGRHSNIIILGDDGKVIDSIKRVDREMSEVRPILPGVTYTLPPLQDKANLLTASNEEIREKIMAAKGSDIAKGISLAVEGMSALLAREAVFYGVRSGGSDKNALTGDDWNRLFFYFDRLREALGRLDNGYTIVYEQGERPKDFSFVPIGQYGALLLSKQFDTPSGLLDSFYSERVRVERMKQRSNDLLKLLVTATDRVSRKVALQKEELLRCEDREQLKQYGDILSAGVYQLTKGQKFAELYDFYHNEMVKIPLDEALTPVQNVQKYYKEYRKAATAERMLRELIEKGEQELIYLDSVFDAVSRTSGESELLEIREELSEQGYLKHYRGKSKMLKSQPPLKYRSSDGYLIYCGRNNKQNDKLTLREARKEDIWFHTQGFAGSHTLLVTGGKELEEIPDRTIEEAAMIAAFNSKARSAALVPVDYTQIRNVRKPAGAKPGMVIFDHYFTLYITPEEEKVASLLEHK